MPASLGFRVSQRNLRLFLIACCFHIREGLKSPRVPEILHLAERYADGLASNAEREAGYQIAIRSSNSRVKAVSALLAHPLLICDAVTFANWVSRQAFRIAAARDRQQNIANPGGWSKAERDEQHAQARLIGDIFGIPGAQKTIDPRWLGWNEGCVVRIAQGIYDDKRFQDMPILADALLDAGCDDEVILAHCREPGEHVRGCWVIDLVLGKS
jgi:hypothetical protein